MYFSPFIKNHNHEHDMNTKAIYAAGGGIAAVAVAIFLIMSTGIFSNSNSSGQGFNQGALMNIEAIKLSIKNVAANETADRIAEIQVAFDAYNPNMGTVILEAIGYNVFVDNMRIVSGDIGEKPEGFVASQEGIYPIIGNGTVTLKDVQTVERNDMNAAIWDKLVDGSASYIINGTYSYKQTSSFQATGGDKEFQLAFH
ncbi:MAG TPA: hypothetical protein VF233_11920 [Nitrososphaeraceae archaeon]